GRRAADLPIDVARLRAAGQDDPATDGGDERGRHLEDVDGVRVTLRVERQVARRDLERRRRLVETRRQRQAAEVPGEGDRPDRAAGRVVVRRGQVELRLSGHRIGNVLRAGQ